MQYALSTVSMRLEAEKDKMQVGSVTGILRFFIFVRFSIQRRQRVATNSKRARHFHDTVLNVLLRITLSSEEMLDECIG